MCACGIVRVGRYIIVLMAFVKLGFVYSVLSKTLAENDAFKMAYFVVSRA